MIAALLSRLHADAALSDLLDVVPGDSRIHPHSVAFPGPAVSYEVSDLTSEGTRISQVTFRTTSPDFDLTRLINERLILNLNVRDASPGWWDDGTNILTCKLNGGGSLELGDVGLYQRFSTFDVKWRDR
jgi:hypothetical protein